MKLVIIECVLCSKKILRSNGRVNEAKKFGWNPFCSTRCMAKSKMRGQKLQCGNPKCKGQFYRPLKEIQKVKQSFCSASCSAKFYNKLRAAQKPINHCLYGICGIDIPQRQKYCSSLHANQARRMTLEEQREDAIERIKSFYMKHQRIPAKREMYGLYKEARRAFGSWNKTIEAAGYESNPVMFAKKYTANDGHKCDSFAEKIIDDWLCERKIEHKRNVHYPANKKLTVDFVIGDNWLEFFGLVGVIKKYDKLHKKKLKLAKKYNIKLIGVYPGDLFPINNLAKILASVT